VAHVQNLPVIASKDEDKSNASAQHVSLRTAGGRSIPDPLKIPNVQWMPEATGVQNWSPCMIVNISNYMVSRGERPAADWKTTTKKVYSTLFILIFCFFHSAGSSFAHFTAITLSCWHYRQGFELAIEKSWVQLLAGHCCLGQIIHIDVSPSPSIIWCWDCRLRVGGDALRLGR